VFTILLATGEPRSLACMGLASGRRRQPSNQRPEDAGSQRSRRDAFLACRRALSST
jgi:hypothetical protein